MHSFLEELVPLQRVHIRFANWERAKHRADFFAQIAFPDSHPLRKVLVDMGRDLSDHRWMADEVIRDVAGLYGDFRTLVNGHFFECAKEWFQTSGAAYWDCPAISFGKGVKRSHVLYLAGVASLHAVESSGKLFAEAVTQLVEKKRPKSKPNLVKKSKLFEKDCGRLGRQLKRIQVCQRDRINVLLCLQRKGVPSTVGVAVLEFLL